jgi:hypothetical protein
MRSLFDLPSSIFSLENGNQKAAGFARLRLMIEGFRTVSLPKSIGHEAHKLTEQRFERWQS